MDGALDKQPVAALCVNTSVAISHVHMPW